MLITPFLALERLRCVPEHLHTRRSGVLFYPEPPCRNVIASEAARWDAEPKSVFGAGAGRPIAMSFVHGGEGLVVGVRIERSTAPDCENVGRFIGIRTAIAMENCSYA